MAIPPESAKPFILLLRRLWTFDFPIFSRNKSKACISHILACRAQLLSPTLTSSIDLRRCSAATPSSSSPPRSPSPLPSCRPACRCVVSTTLLRPQPDLQHLPARAIAAFEGAAQRRHSLGSLRSPRRPASRAPASESTFFCARFLTLLTLPCVLFFPAQPPRPRSWSVRSPPT